MGGPGDRPRLQCACGATWFFEAREYRYSNRADGVGGKGPWGKKLTYFPSPEMFLKCASCGRMELAPLKAGDLL